MNLLSEKRIIALLLSVLLFIAVAVPVYGMVNCSMNMSTTGNAMKCLSGEIITPVCSGLSPLGPGVPISSMPTSLLLSLLLLVMLVPIYFQFAGGSFHLAIAGMDSSPPPKEIHTFTGRLRL